MGCFAFVKKSHSHRDNSGLARILVSGGDGKRNLRKEIPAATAQNPNRKDLKDLEDIHAISWPMHWEQPVMCLECSL
jgi:hypothetical protein